MEKTNPSAKLLRPLIYYFSSKWAMLQNSAKGNIFEHHGSPFLRKTRKDQGGILIEVRWDLLDNPVDMEQTLTFLRVHFARTVDNLRHNRHVFFHHHLLLNRHCMQHATRQLDLVRAWKRKNRPFCFCSITHVARLLKTHCIQRRKVAGPGAALDSVICCLTKMALREWDLVSGCKGKTESSGEILYTYH